MRRQRSDGAASISHTQVSDRVLIQHAGGGDQRPPRHGAPPAQPADAIRRYRSSVRTAGRRRRGQSKNMKRLINDSSPLQIALIQRLVNGAPDRSNTGVAENVTGGWSVKGAAMIVTESVHVHRRRCRACANTVCSVGGVCAERPVTFSISRFRRSRRSRRRSLVRDLAAGRGTLECDLKSVPGERSGRRRSSRNPADSRSRETCAVRRLRCSRPARCRCLL